MIDSCFINDSKKSKSINNIAEFIRAIDEPNRLRIICLLKRGEHCVCDIFKPLELSQNLVSHHLKALKDIKLIDSRKEGTKVIYFRNEKVIKEFSELLNKYLTL
ncbi:MAG: metalloregulator ArsR/SmtB family transcription factor [Patescibacteria group bacterium]